MMIDIKARNEQGDVLFEGSLNRKEVGFLLGYAINDLVAAGVQFHLDQPSEKETEDGTEELIRFEPPKGKSH